MKLRLFIPAFSTALLLSLAIIAGACGGGKEITLQEYFQRIDKAQDDFAGRSGEQSDKLNEALTTASSEEKGIAAWRDAYGETITIVRDFVDALEDIDPPAEAKEAHKELTSALADAADLLQELRDKLADAQSTSDLEKLFTGDFEAKFTAVGGRIDQACFALQGTADQNSISVDLACGE